ncbi:hypothetical protein [Sporosarcina sp. FA9]
MTNLGVPVQQTTETLIESVFALCIAQVTHIVMVEEAENKLIIR